MQSDQKFISNTHIMVAGSPVTLRSRSNREQTWFAVMAVAFFSGLLLGIGGLIISLLTVCGVLSSSRPRSLTATAMIVASLAALAIGAHAMDRMDLAARERAEIIGEEEK